MSFGVMEKHGPNPKTIYWEMFYVGFPNSGWNSINVYSILNGFEMAHTQKVYSKGYIDQGIKERGKLY